MADPLPGGVRQQIADAERREEELQRGIEGPPPGRARSVSSLGPDWPGR
ncbi:hypothetical protein QF034_000178 [Streptomyces africanus]|uniref:Uncharacterized protein n=1 Tax=Streptomyces africanus TaxID=231024 RepID=A0ABU0QHH1_9ACTN|nr:hypothetical protein [Streptomyces africanus]MDQ0745947.1 hypothetical protein [Streptomyces africanus]